MARREPLVVKVKSNGVVIGTLSTSEFMDYARRNFGIGSQRFLSDYVEAFNKGKESIGEPERVEVVLNK
jgi:hypothetical protein